MEESSFDLLWNSEPAFYLDWQGGLLGLLILSIILWGFWQDLREG